MNENLLADHRSRARRRVRCLCCARPPRGSAGLDEISGGGLPAGRPTLVCGGSGLRQDHVRGRVPSSAARWTTASRGCSSRSRNAPTSWSRTSPRSASISRRPRRPGEGHVLDHVRVERSGDRGDRRVRSGGASSSGSGSPSTRSAPGGWCSTPSRRSSRLPLPTRRWCGPSCAGSSPAGSRSGASPPSSRPSGARGRAHARRPRGVRLRLRHSPRRARARAGGHPPPARRQVSRVRPRHQRVPLPHPRARHLGAPHHLDRPPARGLRRARVSTGVARLDVSVLGGKGLYRGSSVLVSGTAGAEQDQPGPAHAARGRLPPWREVPVLRLRGVAGPRSRATCGPSASISRPGWRTGSSASSPRAPRCSGWRCTSPPCTGRSRSSRRTWWWWDPHHQPALHRERDRRPRHWRFDPPHRLPQGADGDGPLHQPSPAAATPSSRPRWASRR